MKLTVRITTIVILISSFSNIVAQKLTSLDYNHAIKSQLIEEQRIGKTNFKSTPFTPPPPQGSLFFDDFSSYQNSVFPNSNWTDHYAFINHTYPDSCISIGVATLDAIDDIGNIYSTDEETTPSDTLTSIVVPLNSVTGNVYLSFFVQGGGKGDAPEEKDTLIVEFYKSGSSRWEKVWDTTGYKSHTFKQIIIPIDSEYKTSGFRFRFRNYTSLNLDDIKGKKESALGNRDFWNIDYVQVKSAANINTIKALNDVAITEPLLSTYQEYYSIPYDHFEVATSYRRTNCPLNFRTYYPFKSDDIKVSRSYSTWNIYKGLFDWQMDLSDLQNDELPMSWIRWNDDFDTDYQYYPNQDYGHFMIKAAISVDNTENLWKWNDTVTREENFKDYYAYDDGTAEAGFGLPGDSYPIKFAVMFNIYTYQAQDTLTAVDIYFPQSRNNANKNVEFLVCVWKAQKINDSLIIPAEQPIYPTGDFETLPKYTPDTNLSINEFTRIWLTEDLIVPDTIFVGLLQYSTDCINIGYDINTNSRSKMRSFKNNSWIAVENDIPIPGSLMIRPVFDHKVYNGIKEVHSFEPGQLTIYPNPAGNYISIVPKNFRGDFENYQVSIVNVLGQDVVNGNFLEDQTDISNLRTGIYFVRVFHVPSKSVYIQKFLKIE
jgi:hypothetical protein